VVTASVALAPLARRWARPVRVVAAQLTIDETTAMALAAGRAAQRADRRADLQRRPVARARRPRRGVGVAAVLAWRKAAFWLVILAAAATTAAVRVLA
jgi:hypothetical protein